ncbi:MAG: helix-turn-helix transcriptional regulator, partial [Bacteroidetes bacterium]|nr:helix-turn-helix transcriptional regulator [Bacteroidota bacterium]
MDKNSETGLAFLGRRIRKLREMNDFSQEFIANELNMSISGYSRIERDEVKLTLDKLIIICRILDISIE